MAFDPACPVPLGDGGQVLLAHGEGARLTRRLIRTELLTAFDHPALHALGDAALLPDLGGAPVMTTDGFVVTPLFFPGGDIGSLAVHGTVNDLAVSGAEPLYLSLGFILEEGLPLDTLRRVIASVKQAVHRCGVAVVTGDTKVVPRGAADQMFLHTTGLGRRRPGVDLGPHRVRPGDAILVSGTLGDHGIAVLTARESFGFEGDLTSDSAPLHELVASLFAAHLDVHWLRDPTRGGVAAALHELAEATDLTLEIDEAALPVASAVRGACEVLGLDPLFVANEGKLLAVVAAQDAARAVEVMRNDALGRAAAVIGRVHGTGGKDVLVRSLLGSLRVLDEPTGAPLPRIC